MRQRYQTLLTQRRSECTLGELSDTEAHRSCKLAALLQTVVEAQAQAVAPAILSTLLQEELWPPSLPGRTSYDALVGSLLAGSSVVGGAAWLQQISQLHWYTAPLGFVVLTLLSAASEWRRIHPPMPQVRAARTE